LTHPPLPYKLNCTTLEVREPDFLAHSCGSRKRKAPKNWVERGFRSSSAC
jgi:hypothetical protein